ncbi:uncharacterized protein BP5553_10341 [Venustampulla echinocandica]|uniref:Uncharacterized protein n=1 Tax=Venustampulla echinocandica TaxID=2656787 RepID=A0A370T9Z7_9HELO|nr:uncharacterized protein BP5553_10341 [Venustampulla echinocandica]RDL30463.1 hypothetical protein BP5553_10341 [Venustampulla echinocandica]
MGAQKSWELEDLLKEKNRELAEESTDEEEEGELGIANQEEPQAEEEHLLSELNKRVLRKEYKGQLTCIHSPGTLNKLHSQDIYSNLPKTGAVHKKDCITLNKAVQLFNNRGTVSVQQAAGRTSSKRRMEPQREAQAVRAKRTKVASVKAKAIQEGRAGT